MDSTYQVLNITTLDDVVQYYAKSVFHRDYQHRYDGDDDDAVGKWWTSTGSVQWRSSVNQSAIRSVGSGSSSTTLVINALTLHQLDRELSGANLSCVVNNTNLAPALSRRVQIDLNCK